jgi:large subunit ribosomal protein L24
MSAKIKKGDQVIVLSGKDKGKTGAVTSVNPSENKVVVEGLNISKRHTKPTKAGEKGGIVDIEVPLHVSKVAAVTADGKPSRVGFKVKADGTKVRVMKKSGAELP